MNLLAFVFLFLAFFGFLGLMLLEVRRAFVVTPFLLFAAFEILQVWPPAVIAYFDGLSRTAFPVLVAAAGFLAMMCGYLVGRALSGGYFPGLAAAMQKRPVLITHRRRYYLAGIVFVSLFLLALGFYLHRGFPPISSQLAQLASGSGDLTELSLEARLYRTEITKGHILGSESYRGQGAIGLFMRLGWPFVLAMTWLVFDQTRRRSLKMFWVVILAGVAILTLIFVTGDGTRAPLVHAMAYLVVVLLLVRRVRFSHLVIFGVVVILLFVGLSLITGRFGIGPNADRSFAYMLSKTADRAFLGNGINNVYIIEFVEQGVFDYRYGQVQWRHLLNALPGVSLGGLPFAYELAVYKGALGKTTYSTSTYLGTAYIDFGLLGVLVLYALIGIILGVATNFMFSRPKHLEALPLWGWVIYQLGRMSVQGLVGVVAPLAVILVVALLFKGFAQLGRLRLSPPVTGRAGASIDDQQIPKPAT